MTDRQKQELLSLNEWQLTGLALKRQWTNEQRLRVLDWHRKTNGTDQLTLAKEVFGDDSRQ